AAAPPPSPQPAPRPAKPAEPAPVRTGEEPLFGSLRGIDPERTLDNLVVGSYNRFAHAAVMSLLTSPGSLYNPLIVWGGAGCGKSHLVNALALKLQEQAPHETVWVVSGSALARAAGLAQAAGRGGELIDFASKARALVVDDLHMTGVAEHNRETLVRVFGAVLGAGRQLVVSSLYAPKHIAPIEEALGIRNEKAHAVELKFPNDAAQQAIGAAALARLGFAASTEEKDVFARGLVKDFTRLEDHLRRLVALAALGKPGTPLGKLLREIFAPDADSGPLGGEKLKASMPKPPPEGRTPLVLCHPPQAQAHADFLLGRLGETAKARGWSFPWRAAARCAYKLDNPFAAPYQLAEDCLQAGGRSALVVGPPPGCELAEQERPFRAVAMRLLAEAGVPCAFVPYARVQDPKHALFAFLDLCAPRGGRG
ncbi:MAG: ATP-binding protein, partial [Elusimicrobia bacterium]|nr:ATP-binding protein [Elusimicrobiota bacterium]